MAEKFDFCSGGEQENKKQGDGVHRRIVDMLTTVMAKLRSAEMGYSNNQKAELWAESPEQYLKGIAQKRIQNPKYKELVPLFEEELLLNKDLIEAVRESGREIRTLLNDETVNRQEIEKKI